MDENLFGDCGLNLLKVLGRDHRLGYVIIVSVFTDSLLFIPLA